MTDPHIIHISSDDEPDGAAVGVGAPEAGSQTADGVRYPASAAPPGGSVTNDPPSQTRSTNPLVDDPNVPSSSKKKTGGSANRVCSHCDRRFDREVLLLRHLKVCWSASQYIPDK